jgi:hypothetical protein
MRKSNQRRNQILVMALGLAAAMVCGGCGGGGSELLECDEVEAEFTPCGGDPTGSWELVQNCPGVLYGDSPIPLEFDCPTATMELVLELRGTLDVGATTVQWGSTTYSASQEIFVPASCVSDAWAGDCANVAAQLESSRPGVVCTAEADASCTCHFDEYELDDTHDSYNYDIFNGNEILYGTGPNDAPILFCVQGDEMTWQDDSVVFGTQYMRFERR